MTIEQLLNCSAEKLEKMTDAELLAWFAPMLHITRPDQATKPQEAKVPTPRKSGGASEEAKRRAQEIADSLGMGSLFKNL